MASSSSDVSSSGGYTLSDYFRDNNVKTDDRNEIINRIGSALIAAESVNEMENSSTGDSQLNACAYFRKRSIQQFQGVSRGNIRYPLIVVGDRKFTVIRERKKNFNLFSWIVNLFSSSRQVKHKSARQGGCKTVFPAIELSHSVDPLNMRVFAWAIISKAIPTSTESKIEESFNKEVGMLREFRNPRTVELIETVKFIGKEDRLRLGMLMEWCPYSLGSKIRSSRETLTDPEKLQYVRALIEMLLMLKAKGIYFRDLKGDNLLIDAEGNLKLADFGQAVPVQEAYKSTSGTIAYRSPDYIKGDVLIDEAYKRFKKAKTEEEKNDIRQQIEDIIQRYATLQGDVWAAGIIIYKLFYGKHPIIEMIRKHSLVPGEVDIKKLYEDWLVSNSETIQTHIDEIFEDDHVSNTIMGILKGMLVLDPEQRFTCEDVKALIDRVV